MLVLSQRRMLIQGKIRLCACWKGSLRLLVCSAICLSIKLHTQPPDESDWQKRLGQNLAFDVESVKPSTTLRSPAFPLDSRDAKILGGRFSASFPVAAYIFFAYKLRSNPQQEQELGYLPKSVQGLYDIEAKAEGDPTKDEMRLMMQSLLAERFKLKVHFETKEVPVLALKMVVAGKSGPSLRLHSEGPPCPEFSTQPISRSTSAESIFPARCETIDSTRKSSVMRLIGGRNITMSSVAEALFVDGHAVREIDKDIVDRTELSGKFDFTIEFMPRPLSPSSGLANPDTRPPIAEGPSFLDAVRQQLGLKLVSDKAAERILVIDHVENPSEN